MTDTPVRAAPYPADTRAKGWNVRLDIERIRRSDTFTLARSGLAKGMHLLMLVEAWQQAPCGSLPSDDAANARLIGARLSDFAKYRRALMCEWVEADDGRLYIAILTDQVHEMLANRARGWRKFRDEVIERDGHRCTYCGRSDVVITLDHVIARARGGIDDSSNLVPACKPCNSSKGARTLEEWKGRH